MNSINFKREIISAIQEVVGSCSKEKPIALHEPSFLNTNASKYLKDCIDSGWVSSAGSYVNKFENEICKYTKAKYCVALVNGTVSIRLALHLIGVKPGDEVLLPAISFVATANAVSHLGAVPHFVDIDSQNIGLSPAALDIRLREIAKWDGNKLVNRISGRRISAILAVHIFGFPASIIEIKKISEYWKLPLVEDCAEALGSWTEGVHCGLTGDIGTLSFNGNKILTTGGGGAIITKNSSIAKRARHLSTTAKISHPWEYIHDEIAWNDRMPNINAALGLAQMEKFPEIIGRKRKLFDIYQKAFKSLNGVRIMKEHQKTKSNYWLITLLLNEELIFNRHINKDEILNLAHDCGLLLRPLWKPLNLLKMYKYSPAGVLEKSNQIEKRLINLPSSPKLLNNE